MSGITKIEWAEKVWNPIRGCTRVSEGCRHCYAERIAGRFSGVGQSYEGLVKDGIWTGKIVTVPEALDAPLKWKKPARIFVNSMSDLFHEAVPEQFITDIFGVMMLAYWHQFLILTKRPLRAFEYLDKGDHGIIQQFVQMQTVGGMAPKWFFKALDRKAAKAKEWQWPLPNVWLGVSVEDQATADRRIPLLVTTPARIRWVSYEPALGPVDFSFVDFFGSPKDVLHHQPPIDWIVAGGESGPGARPAHPDWFRAIRNHCQKAGVPFFFKQWGEWLPIREAKFYDVCKSVGFERMGKKVAGRLLDGLEHSEYPT